MCQAYCNNGEKCINEAKYTAYGGIRVCGIHRQVLCHGILQNGDSCPCVSRYMEGKHFYCSRHSLKKEAERRQIREALHSEIRVRVIGKDGNVIHKRFVVQEPVITVSVVFSKPDFKKPVSIMRKRFQMKKKKVIFNLSENQVFGAYDF